MTEALEGFKEAVERGVRALGELGFAERWEIPIAWVGQWKSGARWPFVSKQSEIIDEYPPSKR